MFPGRAAGERASAVTLHPCLGCAKVNSTVSDQAGEAVTKGTLPERSENLRPETKWAPPSQCIKPTSQPSATLHPTHLGSVCLSLPFSTARLGPSLPTLPTDLPALIWKVPPRPLSVTISATPGAQPQSFSASPGLTAPSMLAPQVDPRSQTAQLILGLPLCICLLLPRKCKAQKAECSPVQPPSQPST